MYVYLLHFPCTKNMAFQHTFYAMQEIPHMWAPEPTKKPASEFQ